MRLALSWTSDAPIISRGRGQVGAWPAREDDPAAQSSECRPQRPEPTATEESPIIDQLGRLASLLREYERDDVWLHVTQIYPLTSQHVQVVVTVKDNQGTPLRERSGRRRPHTFRIKDDLPAVNVGHRFHVSRHATGVRVKHVPAFGSQ